MIYKFKPNVDKDFNFIYSEKRKGFVCLTYHGRYTEQPNPPELGKSRVMLAPSNLSDWGEYSD